MSFTSQEKKDLKDDWEKCTKTIEIKKSTGSAFFEKLFRTYPEYMPMFKFVPSAGRVTAQELDQIPRMRAHINRFMNALDGLVENVEDPDCLVQMLNALTDDHIKRGLGIGHFKNTFAVLQQFLSETLTSSYHKEAWTKLLNTALAVIEARMIQKKSEAGICGWACHNKLACAATAGLLIGAAILIKKKMAK